MNLALIRQFLRFGTVGAVGFFIDTATVYSVRSAVGLYAAGIAGYLTAATGNWALNRIWTFRDTSDSGPAWRQWLLFLAANFVGFLLNRGTYVVLIAFSPLCDTYPVLAIAAGSLAGMFVNFALSRRVFGAPTPE
jgi:putative flippase GtrA